MDCKKVENRILFYVNDELSDSEKQLFKTHLSECKSCSLLTLQIKESFSMLSKNKIVQKDPYFYSRLKARMEQNENLAWKTIFRAKPILQFTSYIILGIFAITAGHIIANDIGINYKTSSDVYEITDEELFANMNYLSLNSDDIYVMDTNEFE